MVVQHRKMAFYYDFRSKMIIFRKFISGFLWLNYLTFKKVLSIFDFDKIPNSSRMVIKRLEGLGYAEIILQVKFTLITWSFCANLNLFWREMTKGLRELVPHCEGSRNVAQLLRSIAGWLSQRPAGYIFSDILSYFWL